MIAMKNIITLFCFLLLGANYCSAKDKADSLFSKAPLAAMSGTYTVNPSQPASVTNFQNIQAAVTALNTNGIGGPVIISIYNGTYNSASGTVSNLVGTSATNTITFTSFSNDSLQVKIAALDFLNTNFVIIKKLWVEKLTFTGTSSNVLIQNNSIRKMNWAAADNLLIENNFIFGGLNLGRATGATGTISNVVVRNNNLKNGTATDNGFNYFTIWNYVNRPVFEGNKVEDVNLNQTGYSLIGCCTYIPYEYGGFMDFESCTDSAFIRNNQFLRSTTQRFIVNKSAVVNDPTLSHVMVYNNFFTTTGFFGMDGTNASFFYNNVNNLASVNSGGFVVNNSFSGFKNNIFSAANGGPALIYSYGSSAPSDYNNFYTTGNVLIRTTKADATNTDYPELISWKTVSGKDAHSLSVNPKYYDSVNLHVRHPYLMAKGTPFPTTNPVMTDIDGQNRNQLNPCMGADEFQAITTDVVVSELIGLKNNFSANSPQPISIKIKNSGSAPLGSLQIKTSINGVMQPNVPWNGNLAYDSTTQILVGNYQFDMLKFSSLKIWTEMPNGVADMVPINDTTKMDSIIPYAHGSFTIGGNNPDLESFSKAATVLNYGGIDGPVTINIRNGKYTEKPVMKFVKGANEINTITFKGENNNAALDTLSFTSNINDPIKYATLRLDSAAYYIFKHLTFQTVGSFSREIEFANKSRFITFDSCVFTSAFTKPSYAHMESVAGYNNIPPGIDSNVVISYNQFKDGGNGINLSLKNGIVKGNTFTGSYSTSLLTINIGGSFMGKNSLLIDSNVIENLPYCSFLYGGVCYSYTTNNIGGISVSVIGNENDITISRNKINVIGRTGINVGSSGTASQPIKVFNNMVSVKNSGTGFYSNGNYVEVFNNNFNDSASTANVVGIEGTNNSFRNNVLVKETLSPYGTSGSLLLVSNGAISTLTSSNNAYSHPDTSQVFTKGSTLMGLNQWQTSAGVDLNSVKINKSYIGNGNLHIDKNKSGAIDLFKKGIPISYITKDFDNEVRNTTAPSIGADEFVLNNYDGGVIAINGFGSTVSPGSQNIKVSLRNFGNMNLTSSTINWSVNDEVQTSYNWTGNLITGDTAVNINIGSFNFNKSIEYKIKVWSSNISGDANNLNDSAFLSVLPSLCGNYTIGGTTPDFINLKSAVNYAAKAGISCAIVFNIRDGVYNEADTINAIPGSSAINTLTFQSESGDSSKVVFSQGADYTAPNPILRINDGIYIKFKGITFKRTGIGYYYDVINIIGKSHDISFTNCGFFTEGAGIILNFNNLANAANFDINNNRFAGGKTSVSMNGGYNPESSIRNINIKNNYFYTPVGSNSSNDYTISAINSNVVHIENNYIDSCISGQYQGGIYLYNFTGKVNVLNNKLIKLKGAHGINLQNAKGLNFYDSAIIVANNFITIDSSANISGIYAKNIGQNVKIVYNNILSNNTNNYSSALQISSNSSATFKDTIANNNLISLKNGYAIDIQPNNIFCTNNNLYAEGNAKVAYYNNVVYSSIGTLPTTNGTNANTISMNPLFLSNYNLHVGENALKTAGKPLSYVTTDIDGDIRGTTATTIGADEIVVKNNDIGITSLITPVLPFAAGNQNITVGIKNFGADNLTSAVINWSINGQLQTPYNFVGNIASGSSGSAIIGTSNFVIDSSYKIKIWPSLPNGATDAEPMNDTLLIENVYVALNGTYTIGASNSDFKTFSRSSVALKYGGILGNVTFNVKDGVYNETLRVDSIPLQNNKSVTWQSQSGDSSKVILKYTPVSNDKIYGVVHLDNTRNITIRNMTIQVKLVGNVSTTYSSIIYFSTKNFNANFLSNRIIDSTYNIAYGGDNTQGSLFISNKKNAESTNYIDYRSGDSAITISGNLFKQTNLSTLAIMNLSGAWHSDYAGNVTVDNYLNNLKITNNRFDMKLFSKPALDIRNTDSVIVSGNKLTGSVYLYSTKLIIVDKNDIYHEGYNQTALTVVAGKNRPIGFPVIVSNNTIQSKVVGTYNGSNVNNTVFDANGDRITIIHNTLMASDTGSVTGFSSGAVLKLNGKYDTVKNNLLYNLNGGYLIQNSASVTDLVSDNNNYVFSNHFATDANNLNEYRAKYGQDAQSVVNINPYFKGPKDLHATNILLKIAPAITSSNPLYNTDIDGTTRGTIVCFGADEFLQPENDLVVLDVTPKKGFSVGNQEFKIRVYNNGSKPITGFNVLAALTNYKNSNQPTNAGSINYTFSGNIPSMTETIITLGTMNVPLYRIKLKVNTSNLNGVGDEVNYNDSLQIDNVYAGLNGIYTFRDYGNNSPADLESFVDVKNQLEQGGVYGSTILKLLPGFYNSQLSIDSIPNRGAQSPLIIESANGDKLTTGFKNVSGGPALKIFSANNVTIRNLSFDESNATAQYNLALGWNSQYITVENCYFKQGVAWPNTTNVYIGGYWSGQKDFTDSNYIFRNNILDGGMKGLSIYGNSAKPINNVVISNNIFTNQSTSGIDVNMTKNVLIDKNSITTNSVDTAFIGILGESIGGQARYLRNKIFIENDGIGISTKELYGSYYLGTDTLIIANNFITTGAVKASINMQIESSKKNHTYIYYNSLLNRSTSVNAVSLHNTAGPNMEVLNNIMYNKNAGKVLVIYKSQSNNYLEHHNLLYTPGSTWATVNTKITYNNSTVNNYNSLAALAASGIDYSSISGNPLFISDNDLHTEGGVVNDKGTYETNTLVNTDIDGETRSNTIPDIGADEFSIPNFGVVQLESPISSCGHTAAETVSVWVKNFGTSTRSDIPVGYRINNGVVVKDTVRTMINPGDSLLFVFAQKANLLAPTDYYFDVFSDYRGDEVKANDTLHVLVATSPANNVLPYYSGFEGNGSGWYTGGQNSSFKWGVVYSGIIDSAANGLNAWKTNLTGPYNNNEKSYLYSPCFDLTSVTENPTLNFNLAYQFENELDKAWVEYSEDGGATWTKLGVKGEGLGWYNNAGNYWTGNNKYWHNAKHIIPTSSMSNLSSVKLRFVVESNGSGVQDGLSIDDISIYIGSNPPVSSGTYTNRTAVSSGTGTFIPVNDPSGNRILEINDNGQNLGNISVDVNQNQGGAPTTFNGDSYLGRNFVIHVQNAPTSPVLVRLFITQQEFNAWQSADPSIDQVRSIAVYKYSGTGEDFDLANNTNGTPLMIQPEQITKIPYLDGYFLEFTVNSFSEFWITQKREIAVPVHFIEVNAKLQNNKTLVTWKVENEQNVLEYQVIHSTDSKTWSSVGTVAYQGGSTQYSFVHPSPLDGINYYQIKQIDHDGKYLLSKIVTIHKQQNIVVKVYPSPFKNTLTVQHNYGKTAMINIYSADGRIVLSNVVAPGTNTIKTSQIAKGVYFYKIISGNELITTGKLVKE